MFQDWGNCVQGDDQVATLQCLPIIFHNVITAAIVFAGAVAVFLIILSGIKFVTSGGDPKQVEGAKHTMTYAIIGLVVVLLSFFIVSVIGALTGTTCINQFGFNNCS